MYAMFLLSILGLEDLDPPQRLVISFLIVILIGISPMGLHAFLYLIYYVWFTIYNAIRAWRGKPVEDAVDYDEFGLLGVITRARRKQEIEKNIELARDRASICDMLNSRTEIVSRSFEHYGLTLISIRIHPYGDTGFACDLEIESGGDTELSDDVCIHVCLFDDNDYQTDCLDITIEADEFSVYKIIYNNDFYISSDSIPTHMKVYVDRDL